MISAPADFSSATSLAVRPKPPAAFSPLRMVRWGWSSRLSGGRIAFTASRPGEPTTSATNRMRKSLTLESTLLEPTRGPREIEDFVGWEQDAKVVRHVGKSIGIKRAAPRAYAHAARGASRPGFPGPSPERA